MQDRNQFDPLTDRMRRDVDLNATVSRRILGQISPIRDLHAKAPEHSSVAAFGEILNPRRIGRELIALQVDPDGVMVCNGADQL